MTGTNKGGSTPSPSGDVDSLGAALVSSCDLALIATDARGVVRLFNVAAERALGLRAADVVGRLHASDILDPREYELRRQEFARIHGRLPAGAPEWELLVGGDGDGAREWTVRRADGERLSAVISFSLLRDADGTPNGLLGIGHDITSLVRAKEVALEAALSEAERARDLFESLATRAPTSVFLIDRGDGARFFNDQLERLLGVPRRELAGYGWLSWIHADDQPAVRDAGRRTFDGGEITKVEVRFVRPDGSIRWAVIRSAPLQTADGEARCAVGTVADTTQRKLLEQALYAVATELSKPQADATAMYRLAAVRIAELLSVEIALIAVVQGNTARTVAVCVDGRIEENFEYPLAGTPCADVMQETLKLVPRDLRQRFPDDRIAAGLSAESYAGVCLRDSSGTPMGLLAVASRHEMPDAESTTPALHVFASRVAAELERERSEENYRDLFEFSPDAMIMNDPDGTIVLANRAAENLFGYAREELVGRPIGMLRATEPVPAAIAPSRDLAEEGAGAWPGQGGACTMRRKDGVSFPCEVSLGLLTTPRGPILATAVRDVTERRRAEQTQARFAADLARQVAERTASLAAANRELDAFAASVSHDLRAPLRRIQGFTSVLAEQLEGRLTDEESAWARKIADSALEMDVLIGALLDAARSARAELHEQELDVAAMAGDIVDELLLDERRARVQFRCSTLPAVLGDPVLVEQVLRNLLSNAIKYSRPRSEPVIELGCDGVEDGRAVLFVRDNGVGFDLQQAPRLFGMFQRLHHPGEFEGTGVGLANVQRIVERHGGRVWAEAAPGRGATFRFTLALAAPVAAAPRAARADS